MENIQAAGGLVHHQDVWVHEHGAGNADALPLAPGEAGAHLSHRGFIAEREGLDKVMDPSPLGCPANFLSRGVGLSQGNVFGNGSVEKKGVLLQYGDALPQFCQTDLL